MIRGGVSSSLMGAGGGESEVPGATAQHAGTRTHGEGCLHTTDWVLRNAVLVLATRRDR